MKQKYSFFYYIYNFIQYYTAQLMLGIFISVVLIMSFLSYNFFNGKLYP